MRESGRHGRSRPPWDSMMARTTERPRPLPPGSRERCEAHALLQIEGDLIAHPDVTAASDEEVDARAP